jgi:hypothetical protein
MWLACDDCHMSSLKSHLPSKADVKAKEKHVELKASAPLTQKPSFYLQGSPYTTHKNVHFISLINSTN